MTQRLTETDAAGLREVLALVLADHDELAIDDPERAAKVMTGINYIQALLPDEGRVRAYGM